MGMLERNLKFRSNDQLDNLRNLIQVRIEQLQDDEIKESIHYSRIVSYKQLIEEYQDILRQL